MSDSEKSLDLMIRTTADLAAFKAASAELEYNIAKAKAMGKEYGDMEVQLGRVDGALEDYRAKTGETGEEVDKLELSHRTLRKAMSAIGPEGAELSEAIMGAMEGPIGIVITASAVFEILSKWIGEAAEKTQELAVKQAELNTSVWTAQRDAANEAADAAAKYADVLDRISAAHDDIKKKEADELEILKAKQAALEVILKAQEAAELAAANGDKIKEAEIKARYGAKISQASLTDEAQTISTEHNQLLGRNIAAPALKTKADADEAAYEAALKSPQASLDKAKLDQLASGQGDLDKKAGEYDLGALREKLKTASTVGGESGGQSDASVISQQIEEGEKAAKAAADNRTKVEALNAAVEEQKQAVERAKAAADKSATAMTENDDARRDLTDKIKTQTAIYQIHKQTDATVKGIEAPETPYGKALTAERGDAIKVATGHAQEVSTESQNMIQQLGALIAGHSVTLKEAAKLIAAANDNNNNFTSALDAIKSTADTMRGFSQATVYRLQQIDQNIAWLTGQIGSLKNR